MTMRCAPVGEDFSQILSCILDVGQTMLTAGSEVNRVEDTMERMARAYGCKQVDVFTITSSIVVTVHDSQDAIYTQTRRIREYETDIHKIELCNALSREICRKPLSQEEFTARIERITREKTFSWWIMCIGYVMVAASFTVFFGGSLMDALISGISGFLLYWILQMFGRIRLQRIVTTILASAMVGLIAAGGAKLGLGVSVDKICIGNVMLLIPGISFTTSLRDMISGDTISGLLGLVEAVLRALAIALGFALVLWWFGL